MKKLCFAIFASLFLCSSCGSDCDLTDINEIIIGDWTLNGFDVSFNADGTMSDPTGVFLLSVNNIELNDKSYTIEGDSILNIRFSNENPPASGTTKHTIVSYECEQIVTNYLTNFTFIRK